jgi:hypothetical protein
MVESRKELKFNNNRPEVVELPADCSKVLPPKAAVQLYDMGLTENDICRFDICWSPDRARIIIPVYKYAIGSSGSTAKQLVGLMGRKLIDSDSDKPKWWSVRQRDIKHPRFIGLPVSLDKERKTVVIVEDIFSAIKISAAGFISIALMTTYLPYELYPVLNGWTVHMWLDNDAYNKAVKYQATLGANGVTATTILTDKDPKWYNTREIREAINNGKITS